MACALAACALTSSVTAIADSYDSVSATYSGLTFIGTNTADTTKYSNVFDFETYVVFPNDPNTPEIRLGLDWELTNYYTSKKILSSKFEESEVKEVFDYYSVPLDKAGKVTSSCRHTAYLGSNLVLNGRTATIS